MGSSKVALPKGQFPSRRPGRCYSWALRDSATPAGGHDESARYGIVRDERSAARKRPSGQIDRRSYAAPVAANQDPPVQPNKASSTDERLPDLRATVAATTLQSLARESLLASVARRQASAYASPPKSEMSASISEEIASRSSCGRWR